MSTCIHYTPSHPDWLQKCAEYKDITLIHSGSHQSNTLTAYQDKYGAGSRNESANKIRGTK
jgi:hypothetical protein